MYYKDKLIAFKIHAFSMLKEDYLIQTPTCFMWVNLKYYRVFNKKEEYFKLAEGAATVKALMKLSEEYNVEMPISKLVYDVIYNNIAPMDAMAALFERDAKTEFSKEY